MADNDRPPRLNIHGQFRFSMADDDCAYLQPLRFSWVQIPLWPIMNWGWGKWMMNSSDSSMADNDINSPYIAIGNNRFRFLYGR